MVVRETNNSFCKFDREMRVQAWIFLLVWPGFNLLIITAALHLTDQLSFPVLMSAAGKMWGIFVGSFIIFNALERLFRRPLTSLLGDYTWILRPLAIIFIFVTLPPIFFPTTSTVPAAKIAPLVIVLLETLIYVAVMLILQQQRSYYRSQLQAQQAELQVLKMQSNPHFLFNTLNLIATEVTINPSKAKELIYNLSDLLRSTVRLAKEQWVTVEEELQLVELYLILQQKRFEDRLTFDIDCAPELNDNLLPSLLLLPVVENAIKHGVAPYANPAHISVIVELHEDFLEFEIMDTGEPFDERHIQYGDGMRILTETLRLNFKQNFSMTLSSSNEGANMKIRIPDIKRASGSD